MIERTLTRAYEVSDPTPSAYTPDEGLKAIEEKLAAYPDNAALWMEKGLALAEAALYRESEECYAHAISLEPFNGILYRHMAHRMLSQWRFEDARAGFTLASRLIPENWDVWYHLGLSHFLLRDYAKAAKAYQRCLELSEDVGEYIAVCDWYYMTLRRLGKDAEALAVLDYVPDEGYDGENLDYFERTRMYKGLLAPEEVLPEDLSKLDAIDVITRGFGVSNYYRMEGNAEKADQIVDAILEAGDTRECYFAFGYLAAMADKLER